MSETKLTKVCPHCKATIDKTAKKCQHCSSDLRNWFVKHKILTAILLLIFYIMGSQSLNNAKKTQSQKLNNLPFETNTTTETNDNSNDNLQVGQEGYLRLPNIDDPKQVICLGPTTDAADKITKTMLAKDFTGLLEIKGVFCVGNGTKVTLIEKDFPLRKVRIVKGVNDVDNDKVGLSGWLPYEWVVAK